MKTATAVPVDLTARSEELIREKELVLIWEIADSSMVSKLRKYLDLTTKGKATEGKRYNLRVGSKSFEIVLKNKVMYGKEV